MAISCGNPYSPHLAAGCLACFAEPSDEKLEGLSCDSAAIILDKGLRTEKITEPDLCFNFLVPDLEPQGPRVPSFLSGVNAIPTTRKMGGTVPPESLTQGIQRGPASSSTAPSIDKVNSLTHGRVRAYIRYLG
jgi:hypothetical protein